MKTLLQIVPQAPGIRGGVSDYALNLARELAAKHKIQTTFVIPAAEQKTIGNFAVQALESIPGEKAEHALLHYANYGYQKRGLPLRLAIRIEELQRRMPVTAFFHELYATSSRPRSSAFWLQGLQRIIAGKIARASRRCFASNPIVEAQLRQLVLNAEILLQPVASNLGEPVFPAEEIAKRDPHRWAICGGAALLLRSLRSFEKIASRIPSRFAPRELLLLGGDDSAEVRRAADHLSNLRIVYRPEVDATTASELLGNYSLGWLDYFDRKNVPAGVLLKSSSFAAFLAHGIIPVLPSDVGKICVADDCLPGTFFVGAERESLPEENARPQIAAELGDWYRRHCSVAIFAEKIARAVNAAG